MEQRPRIRYRLNVRDGDVRKAAMVDIKGVTHFTIPVSNIERSKDFY